MRRLQSLLAVLLLALVGCAGHVEPEVTPEATPEAASPTNAAPARKAVALTSAELAVYKKELSQIFAKKNTAPVQRAANGMIADAEGHGTVALVKVDGEGGLVTTCAGSQEEAVQFLSSADGLEVK